MTDLTHLTALEVRLSHERGRLVAAISDSERLLRSVWVSQIEKEILDEKNRLGIGSSVECTMTDDELLAELGL